MVSDSRIADTKEWSSHEKIYSRKRWTCPGTLRGGWMAVDSKHAHSCLRLTGSLPFAYQPLGGYSWVTLDSSIGSQQHCHLWLQLKWTGLFLENAITKVSFFLNVKTGLPSTRMTGSQSMYTLSYCSTGEVTIHPAKGHHVMWIVKARDQPCSVSKSVL